MRSVLIAVGLSVGVSSLSFLIAAALGVVRLPSLGLGELGKMIAQGLIMTAAFTLIFLCEEVGWRGYLLPRLATLMDGRWAAVVVGAIHAVLFQGCSVWMGSRLVPSALAERSVLISVRYSQWCSVRAWPRSRCWARSSAGRGSLLARLQHVRASGRSPSRTVSATPCWSYAMSYPSWALSLSKGVR